MLLKSRKVDVRLEEDMLDPSISDCVFMPNGYLVACDDVNYTIKLFDSSLSLKDSLKLPTHPRHVALIDDNTVIVTIPLKEQLQYVQVFPQITLGQVIQLDKCCWGVDVSGQETFVCCTYPGEIRVLDRQGNMKRRLGIRHDDSRILSNPVHIAVSKAGDKIFVTDTDSKSVACMKTDGTLIYQYKDAGLRRPMGLICDDMGNVMVCDNSSGNIHVIDSNGENFETLSVASQIERNVLASVAYRRSDGSLVVGCRGLEHMFACQLIN